MGNFLTRIFNLSEDIAPVQDESSKVIVIHDTDLGTTGTESYAGYPHEDYLSKMRGSRRADEFDKMRRSDPQVKMLLSAVTNPIKAATWEVEPADDSEEAFQDAEFIKHLLFSDMEKPWDEFIEEALTLVPFGHAVFEITHKVVINHGVFGNYNGIRQLGWRHPRTIERWNLDRETGLLASITQEVQGDLDVSVDIPSRFLMVMSMNKEGSNYEGISMLRCCYGNYMRKAVYLKLNAIGIEKFAVPTPIADIPDEKSNPAQYAAMKEVLAKYTSHQSNYIIKPKGFEVTLHGNAYDPEKVETSIDREDARMAKAFLANFLELGSSGSGSYALGTDLSDFFLGGIEHIANMICSAVNKKLIRDMMIMNRGPREKYPTLKASGISDKAGKELAEVLDSLARSKYIVPDDQLEDHLRSRYKIPARSMEGQRKVEPKPAFGGFSEENSILKRIRLAEENRRASKK